MIKIKIDVTKITKERLYKGQKGTYLNAVLIETPDSQYSEYMIVEESTKDEREAGKRGAIIGNASVVKLEQKAEPDTSKKQEPVSNDLPF